MSIEHIRAELAECQDLRPGWKQAKRLEPLVEEARDLGDPEVEAYLLRLLYVAYRHSPEATKEAVPLARLIQLLEQFPAELTRMSGDIHSYLKLTSEQIILNPAIPLPAVYRWLDQFESLCRQRGYSLRPVLARRSLLARHLGDYAAASELIEASIAAQRDEMADHPVLEHGAWGDWRVSVGDDAGAIAYWSPVLSGNVNFGDEEGERYRILAGALLPLVRSGRSDEARSAFLRGDMHGRHYIQIEALGRRIEFCALTGNEALGMELLAEQMSWLTYTYMDAWERLALITGFTVLLRRLNGLGHGSLKIGSKTVSSTLAALENEIAELCSRYDKRNGNTAVSERIAARIAQEPLAPYLPLNLPGRRPSRAAAILAYDQGFRLKKADPLAARAIFRGAAVSFGSLSVLAWELESRLGAALALEAAGDLTAAREEVAAISERAEEALAAGDIGPPPYLNIHVAGLEMDMRRLSKIKDRDVAAVTAAVSAIQALIVVAQRHSGHRYAARCYRMLAQIDHWHDDLGSKIIHRTAARDAYLAAGQPRYAAHEEYLLARYAIKRGDFLEAAQLGQDAITHGEGKLTPKRQEELSALIAEALRRKT